MQEEFSTWPDFWNQELETEFSSLAMQHYPNEVVAVILDSGMKVLPNLSNTPMESFTVDIPDEYYDTLKGIIHSHPDGNIKPSKEDYATFLTLGVPSGIVTCTADSCSISYWQSEELLSKSLLGRPFIHAYYDCYSLIRAFYYQEYNITLLDHAREDDWWVAGENMYNELFEKTGFHTLLPTDELRRGDIIFMSINSSVTNHAAIYLEEDSILHHLYGRLSRVDKLSVWGKMIDKVVRYNG